MFGITKPQPVEEHEATGEIDRVYHDIRQVLRVSGINLNWRTWAAYPNSFPLVWAALRENAGTYAFEDAADRLRARAVQSALELPALRATAAVPLGSSQLYQLGAALALYHYINPKLLILTAAVRVALEDEAIAGSPLGDGRKLPRGVPSRMYPMEMVSDPPEDPLIGDLFEDIRQTCGTPTINSDYRTLALWPQYLEAAWSRLKPVVSMPEYKAAADALRVEADVLARNLPYRVKLSRLDIATVAEDDEEFIRQTRQFEEILPPLIVNIALLTLDGTSADVCMASPFPVEREGAAS